MREPRTVPPLRIAVLGDVEGLHTRRWIEAFVERRHEVHAIAYAPPRHALPLFDPANERHARLHVLTGRGGPREPGGEDAGAGERGGLLRRLGRSLPPSLQRLIHARRYQRAGLRERLAEIEPDVLHAHYAVEHGFYGASAGFHPYVVSAWGSDLLVESHKPLGRLIARQALRRADLVTANDVSLARRAVALGVPEDRVAVVHLGIDRLFLDVGEASVNRSAPADGERVVISDRALEPLYNVDVVLRAFAAGRAPGVRLIVAGEGSRRHALERLAGELALGETVRFVGQQTPAALAALLASAHLYVSVPSSDSLALSNLEAMAAGAFPILSDLPSLEGWVEDGVNGLLVRPGDVESLARTLPRALADDGLRTTAMAANRAKVEAEGLRERNMQLMERHYYRLAGHPQAGGGEAI